MLAHGPLPLGSSRIPSVVPSKDPGIGEKLPGTPVENRLPDLHSQSEVILPGYLANARAEFHRNLAAPVRNWAVRSDIGATRSTKKMISFLFWVSM